MKDIIDARARFQERWCESALDELSNIQLLRNAARRLNDEADEMEREAQNLIEIVLDYDAIGDPRR